jgi:uncharacterized phage protein (TIGR01671 family)
MNREIKFRAWGGNKMHTICRLGLNGFSSDLWSPSPVSCHICSTNSLVIMQFTGLKDKNGKEIYESDRYVWLSGKNQEMGTIVFFDGMFACRPDNALDTQQNFPLNSMSAELEVIGNIYESPALVKP